MSRSEQKQQTRQRIVDAAGQGFRQAGFGGIGVDGLARKAGVTSGGFYVHFNSKADAFREAVAQGLAGLKLGVLHFQAEYGRSWWPEFVRFYLSCKRTCDLSDSCTLQSLSPEVARSDGVSRAAFEAGLSDVAQAVIAGPQSPALPQDLGSAYAALASLVGAVTLARAVDTPEIGDQIATATERILLGSHAQPRPAQQATSKSR